MSQRYFLTAESTYEDLRQSLNTALSYPNALGKSVFQTALYAPRDNFRRVLLAVDTDLPGYATVSAAIAPLLDSDAMEEIDEATYLEALASATAGASAWNDITGKPTFAAVATSGAYSDLIGAPAAYTLPTATASVLGGVKIGSGVTITDGVISVSTDYAAASDFDQGVKTTDSPRFVRLGLSDPDDEVSEWYVEAIGGVFSIGTRTIGQATGDVWFSVDSSGALLSSMLDWDDVTNKPTLFDGAYTSLTSVPSTFAPSSHKTSHATGGSDALTASDIGAAAASHAHAWSDITSGVPSTFTPSAHNHAASEITSGTLDVSRLPVGTGSTQVAAGDHTHSQLHDRSHAITSSSDHTATAWRAFYSNGSGVITELALGASGTVLTSGGASAAPTFSALPTGGTKTIIRFHPGDNQPPASNFATLDTRNSVLVLEFDAATDESAVFVGYIPEGATLTNGLKVRLSWMADTATSGNVRWGVQFEADGTDLDSDSFDTATLVTSAASGTSGIETVAEITATAIDSLAAGDRFRLKVYRDADDATNDTMTGDAQLVAVEVQVA